MSLVLLALAFGWIEGSVVVYLRQVYDQQAGPHAPMFPVVFLSDLFTRVEVVREACTLVVLAAASWLADRRWAGRIGSFLLLFGIWDLTYYGVLKLVLGWPPSLATWDILFLIPLPWIAPVWAPATVAAIFVGAGSYLFWTANRARVYRLTDAAVLFASACTIVAAFLADWRIAARAAGARALSRVAVLGRGRRGDDLVRARRTRCRRVDSSDTSRHAVDRTCAGRALRVARESSTHSASRPRTIRRPCNGPRPAVITVYWRSPRPSSL